MSSNSRLLAINKSASFFPVVRFCYHSHDYRPNWTPPTPITIMNSTPMGPFSTTVNFTIILLLFQDDKKKNLPEEFEREGMEFWAPVLSTPEKL